MAQVLGHPGNHSGLRQLARKNCQTPSFGGTAAGPAMGYVLGNFGWNSLFFFVAVMYVLTAVFWGFVNCTRRLFVQ